MNEPWISQPVLVVLHFVFLILILILIGTLLVLIFFFAPKGKAKKFTLCVLILGSVLSFILFVFGIIAYFFGQPRYVWDLTVYQGAPIIIFCSNYWLIRKIYRDAELRKLMSEDLTFGSKE